MDADDATANAVFQGACLAQIRRGRRMSFVWRKEGGERWEAAWRREFTNDSDGSSQSDTFDLASIEMLKLLTEHTAPMDDNFLAQVRAVRERYF